MKLATWNVNSIRARLDAILRWLETEQPDVLCMQETKVEDDEFPSDELQMLGYAVAMAGQPTYNGVAIASRLPMKEIQIGLLGRRRRRRQAPDRRDRRRRARHVRLHSERAQRQLTGVRREARLARRSCGAR